MSGTFTWPSTGGGVPTFTNLAAFPSAVTSGNGSLAIALDTNILYESNGTTWLAIAEPGDALTIGSFGSTPNANGLSLSAGGALSMQPADGTHPGGVSLVAQTLGAGDKTITNKLIVQSQANATPSLVLAGVSGALHPNFYFTSRDSSFLVLDNSDSSAIPFAVSFTGQIGIGTTPNGNAQLDVRAFPNEYGLQLFNPSSLPLDFMRLYDGSNTLLANVDNTGKFFVPSANISGLSVSTALVADASKNITSSVTTLTELSYSSGVTSSIQTQLNGKQATGNFATSGSGDVSWSAPSGAGPVTTAIGANKVANSQLAQMATLTIKGNNTGGPANALDLTAAQVNSMLGSLSNPMTTGGDIIYGGSSGTPTRLANGSSGNVLTSAGGTSAPTWAPPATNGTVTSVTFTGDGTVLSSTPSSAVTTTGTVTASLATAAKNTYLGGPLSGSAAAPTYKAFTAPTIQKFLSTGTQTGWLFTISTSSTVAVNDTYTNNSNTYTVLGALTAQSGQVLFMSGTGATSGTTLTRSAGSGTSSITFSTKVALATYTAPTNPAPLYIRVRQVGAGSGGAGSGTVSNSSTAGTTTFFGANIVVCAGGGAAGGESGGNGGSASLTPPAVGVSFSGSYGSAAADTNGSTQTVGLPGGTGGSSAFGGAGAGGNRASAGINAATNSGSGGGGGGENYALSISLGAGGGSGGFADGIIPSPSTTYPYVVGTGGGGGSAGTNGNAGGNGADGLIEVTEVYQ